MPVYERKIWKISAYLLTLAVVIRLLTQIGWDVRLWDKLVEALQTPEMAGFLLYLELGQPLPVSKFESEGESEQETRLEAAPETNAIPEKPSETESAQTRDMLTFTEADAADIEIMGQCNYDVDKLALLQQPCRMNFHQDGPTVLIVHTHTCEAYAQEADRKYTEDATARTRDPNFSVVRVGKELAETLEAHGISVLHDTSINDYPSFNGAYSNALGKIEAWLEKYPSIQMVIDLHRDAVVDANGVPLSPTVTVDGEEAALMMLVVGTDEGGLDHPNWRDNLSWALKLQVVLNRSYPGLCRDLNLRTERFNQHATSGSLLVEVGSSGNTLQQALHTARLLGEGLAELIQLT